MRQPIEFYVDEHVATATISCVCMTLADVFKILIGLRGVGEYGPFDKTGYYGRSV